MRIIVDDGGSNDIYDENIILYGLILNQIFC